MKGFCDILLELEEYNNLISNINQGIQPIHMVGTSESQKTHLVYSIYQHTNRTAMIVTDNELQAKKLYEDLSFFAKNEVLLFPAKEFIFYDIEARSTEIFQQRLRVLDRLLEKNEKNILIISIESLMQITIPYETYAKHRLQLKIGSIYELDEITEKFTVMGYERVDLVEGKGQFSVRGGIIDFHPLTTDWGYRVEFFDNEIDSIREFDIMTQRSTDKVEEVCVPIAREVLIEKERISEIEERLNMVVKEFQRKRSRSKNKEIIDLTIENLHEDIEKITQQRHFPSIDKYSALIYKGSPGILDYLQGNRLVFIDEPSRIAQRAETVSFEYNETVKAMIEKGLMVSQIGSHIVNYSDLISRLTEDMLLGMSTLSHATPDYKPKSIINMVTKTLHSFQGKIDFLCEDLKVWKTKHYRIVILSGTQKQGERLVEVLRERGFDSAYKHQLLEIPQKGEIIITSGSLHKGFEYPLIQFVLVSDKEIFSSERKVKRRRFAKSTNRIKTFTDLNIGDYVVHEAHGIGQYIGIEKLLVEGATKDYIKIKYQGEDYLYVPAEQLGYIQKYIGAEGKNPRLHKLGGTEWTKAKNKVKGSVQDLAKGLVALYAKRESLKGHAFSEDTVWQKEFEEAFVYEETPDQLRCIEEVKKDMERDKPMERLLCGDVGYGKTEVAIRAAFKAVMDSKQVAYLVPTTVLAQQHYNNFVQRMKEYPVTVDVLSRFKSTSEQKSIIEKLKIGKLDIVIGTHRLLQKDIHFKDLGLLIIDEEQRFGVTHKEKIKNLKKDIDVLTLTATPIPRTLHMSMVGVRDMSVIEQPPEDRYPVRTYVLEYNETLIQDAIIREMNRNGQVYYLYNRVKGILRVSQELQKMVPDASIAVAHGQMSEKELEDVMYRVLNGEVDVLVCTTIIETGLDIPNMNTIIIEDADRMGLAQLYQLRGRVGRTNRLAYAYITYQKDKVLQESAEKRLQAIKEFTEFGSGFRIAMRDLEIRGAGNLLGSQQHGHMEAVGYDLYCKLLEEAVSELKGERPEEYIETSIDFHVDAFIPEGYIKHHGQRVEIYKKIAAIENLQDAYDVEEEIEDRYGNLPVATSNLIKIAFMKGLAMELRIISIHQKEKGVMIKYQDTKDIDMQVIIQLISEYKNEILLNAGASPYLFYKIKSEKGKATMLDNVKIILQRLKQLQTR